MEFSLFSPMHGLSFFGSASKSNKVLQKSWFKKRLFQDALRHQNDTRWNQGAEGGGLGRGGPGGRWKEERLGGRREGG